MSEQLVTVPREQPSVALMLQTMIEKGITGDSVAAFGQLVALQERMEARDAEKQFAADFISLQRETPRIKATKAVPDKHGNVKYHFAPYEEIMDQLEPLLEKYGFAVSFSSKSEGTPIRIISVCKLIHRGGHKETTEFGVRIGQGPPGCTETQADGSAASYAKRYALCHALNIRTIGVDDDARLKEPQTITQDQADELKNRVTATKSNEVNFLAWAGAAHYEAIPASKWEAACSMLSERERKQEAAKKGNLL